ncbi:MAG: tRNA pseudouridine(38-40) synthase TruA [Saprospiraceae bacterium]
MRYFLELAYSGTNYFGWQRQPQQISVQQTIEEALSTILNTPIAIMGCGRTDTGVHAKQYFAHFDVADELPQRFVNRINKFLPKDISIFQTLPVADDAHARFDAYHRAYEYHVDLRKNPFGQQTAYQFPFYAHLDVNKMKAAAQLLLDYTEFAPFCKTNHDAKTMKCDLKRIEWIINEKNYHMTFHIAANRFLRGMVRLIVGMCIRVGLGKIELADVKQAMDRQTPLNGSWSAPAQGLYLTDIRYPYLVAN